MTPRNTNTGGVLEAMVLPALTRGGVHKVDAVAEKNNEKVREDLKVAHYLSAACYPLPAACCLLYTVPAL